MSAAVPLLWTFSVIGVTGMFHEFGHAWAARYCGWRVVGFRWRWYGAGCIVEVGNPREMWKVALGGPFATALLAITFLAASGVSSGPFGAFLDFGFTLNASVLLINLLPIPALDGSYIVKSLRRAPEASTPG
jgi:stage IV sporulation protein FB